MSSSAAHLPIDYVVRYRVFTRLYGKASSGLNRRSVQYMNLPRNLPLLLAGLAVALAVAPVLWFIVRFLQEREDGGSIIANDGWGVLPILCVPTVVTLAGFVALARWESRDSRAARRSAWAVALVFLVATLISIGVGPYFWPAAAAFFLATSVRQGSWWALGCAWLISLLLMLAAYSMAGASPYFWPPAAVLLLSTGTLGISFARRR